MIKFFKHHTLHPLHILPLAIYRMAFGFLMFFSQIRFIYKGWVEDCYLNPEFHFTYTGFEWIKPFESPALMYGMVILCACMALFIALGFLYRISTILFFISFTYLELIEKAWYLNHYYFVSLVAFLLCLVPANANFSLDARLFPAIKKELIPSWGINIFKLQISIVYFFAGLAKIKTDWLLHALPLKIWLKTKADIPVIGHLLQYDITAYFFSWFGLVYDLSVAFFLWNKKTRPYALIAVLLFHSMTALLFNIGMFPWVMIMGSLIFVTKDEWNNILQKFNLKIKPATYQPVNSISAWKTFILSAFFIIQLYLPLRHYFYNENMMWTERFFRFGWNVMLMEKNGFCEFTVVNAENGKKWKEYPSTFLTTIQEKQMSFQPDMIWQYAHYLKEKYNKEGIKNCKVYVLSRVSLNGRPSQLFINPETDIASLKNVNEIYDEVTEMKN
ncbi:HTTM domain-containing protein [Abyssalbus ytuae]|uniref:HTTM domain-containing protein n=1 Tax=Abyssalbus ytuae TaxID=2926907 RepID=A0A9E7CTF1_9FLAO|nr:HTTM domain-containing protein [Abyssalbus ytuae]UOB17996.1 HTTM domain-containing protein [Abyssalbus ytuae]